MIAAPLAVGADLFEEESTKESVIGGTSWLTNCGLTLQPLDLRGWSVTFLVTASYSEDDCWLGCHVDVGRSYRLGGDVALVVFAGVNSSEGQLVGFSWVVVFDGQIDRKFGDFSLTLTRWLP